MISYWSCPLTRLGVLTAGGMNVYVSNLANYLGRLGHQVDIYTRTHKERDESLLKPHRNVRIVHLREGSSTTINTSFFSKRLLEFIKTNSYSYDIIHSHYYYSGFIGCELKNTLERPHITTFHTLGVAKKVYLGVNDEKRIAIEKKVIDSVDGIVASTDLESRDLVNYYHTDGKKIFIVVPGVNHRVFKKYDQEFSRLKLNLPKRKGIILFVGRVDPIKGIGSLIEAVANFTKVYPSFAKKYLVLLIGGDIRSVDFWKNKEVKKIKYQIAERELECCVKFIGSQPHHKLPFYYSASDVVVIPSVYESFGLVVLEALACGSTVLASKVVGASFLIRDKVNGRCFESGNIDSLSETLFELLSDKKQRIRLGKEALRASQQYSWDQQAQNMNKVYKNFL